MSRERLSQGEYLQNLAAAATRQLQKDATTQGISTALGMVFYDLRPPAYRLYPVNTPLRNSIPRSGAVNAGVGQAAHWKAYTTPNATNNYAGVAEGKRNAYLNFSEKDFLAAYKELGQETSVTFTAQFAGQGFTDPMADAQTMLLHGTMLSEEDMILGGNTSNLLGTPPTPTVALQAGAGLTTGTNVSVAVVALSFHGWRTQGILGATTITAGLTPSYTRNNADSTTDTVKGGISAVSAMSAVVATTSGNNQVVAKVTAVPGAVAYAWYVNVTDASSPTKSNALLAAITNAPTYTITAAPAGTQTAAATGLNVDNSTNDLSFDGFLTYAAKYGIWNDLGGKSLTPNADGTIAEIEAILYSIWNQYQATVDDIYVSADQMVTIPKAILAGTGGNASNFRIQLDQESKGKIIGGSMVVSYLSRFTMGGSKVINIKLHPALPPGTMLFDMSTNPYPHSELGHVRELLMQRDYYSILYPLRTRKWEVGTYVHEVLAHRLPNLTAVISGAATS